MSPESLRKTSCGEQALRTEARIRELLAEELEMSAATARSFDPAAPLLGQGVGLDSFEALMMITAIEREFGVQFEDAELQITLFESLNHLAGIVDAKLSTP